MSDDMDLPDYARLLRDAATASAATWAEPMDRRGHDRAVRHLGIALRDLRIVVARLAGRFRGSAMVQPEPARSAQAVAVTASMQALAQAWLLLEEVLPAEAVPERNTVTGRATQAQHRMSVAFHLFREAAQAPAATGPTTGAV
jgi:hypothetical protein